MHDHRHNKGFTLLLAMLIISMLLSVSLGITSIIIKENQLSGLESESEEAFHAADKGIDCALFYHISYDRNVPPLQYAPFSTSTAYTNPPNMNTVTCDGDVLNTLPTWSVTNTANTGVTMFTLSFGTAPNAPCAEVTVSNSNSGVDTTIISNGYNTCNTADPRRTLRVIQVDTNLGS